MTDKEIVKRALDKAEMAGNYPMEMSGIPFDSINVQYSIVFSHDFAKAFWGEERVHTSGMYDMKDSYNGCEKNDEECECDHYRKVYEIAYLYHLKQMVLEENPIQYLEKFLDE